MDSVLVEVTRGERVESVHRGHVAVVHANGDLVAYSGDPGNVSYFRSCGKPFQSVPLVASGAADAFELTTEELAMACASHSGTKVHQDVVRSMLRKAGLQDHDLRCGFSPPIDEKEGARVSLNIIRLSPVQCECSGEHAGMLVTCRHMGWAVDTYVNPHHPLQRRVFEVLATASGVPASGLERATDGCSIPTYATSLRSIAHAYAVLADPEGAAWEGSTDQRQALLRLRGAMAAHPVLVSGEGDVDTTIMQVTEGRIIAKLGAEGMIALAIPAYRLGVVARDTSGASRALGPIAVAVVEELGVESSDVVEQLRNALVEPVRAYAGAVVGEMNSTVVLAGGSQSPGVERTVQHHIKA